MSSTEVNTSRKQLLLAFSSLASSGFVRKGPLWNRRTDQTVFACGIDKSPYGLDKYTFLAGLYLPALGARDGMVPVHRCHMYTSVKWGLLAVALDFETPFDRVPVIAAFIDEFLLPLARQCATVDGAGLWAKELEGKGLIWAVARPMLGLPPPDVG